MRCETVLQLPIAVLELLFLISATPAHAGSLDVVNSAARLGSFGLRVSVGSSCAGASDLKIEQATLAEPAVYEGCRTIESSSTEVTGSGTIVFRAGERIALGDGFVVRPGVSFVAEIQRDLVREAYLDDRSPLAEHTYAAGFFLRPDHLILNESASFELVTAYAADGASWLGLSLKRDPVLNEIRMVIRARLNDGSLSTTEGEYEVAVPSGWSWIGLLWKAADPGSSDGNFNLYLDGVQFSTLTGLSNSNGRVDTVRLGASDVEPGASGFMDLDAFQSLRNGPIEPPR